MLFLDKITYHQSGRPIFYIDDSSPCLGSGVLFYINHRNKIYFLMQKEDDNHKYSFCDLGGKTDILDSNIIETAVREVMEETNGILFSKLLKTKYQNDFGLRPIFKDYMINFYKMFQDYQPEFVYSNKSKYLIIMMEIKIDYIDSKLLPKNCEVITTLRQEFGDMEVKNTLSRQIVWMELYHFSRLLKDKKMHIRLKDTQMYHEIDKLKKKLQQY
jgi:hypothetical protein